MSDNMNNSLVWIVGTGNMAREYCKVLNTLGMPYKVIGNSETSVQAFVEATGIAAFHGGIDLYLEQAVNEQPRFVINAVNTPNSCKVLLSLIKFGIKLILAEKPAGLSSEEVDLISEAAVKNNARIVVAYNRRFYSSVLAAKKIIDDDNGVTSFQFEFTELYKIIGAKEGDVSRWFYGNSTHVLDLAFYLGGLPRDMHCYAGIGDNKYTTATAFTGAGVSEKGALFAYQTNWLSPGRWSVEIQTAKHRLIFRPMEKLQIQELGSFAINELEIDDELDKSYKPGIYLQVKTFAENPFDARFLSIEQQAINMHCYQRIHEGKNSL